MQAVQGTAQLAPSKRSPARCSAPSARPPPSRSSARRARSAPATTSASSASRRATRTSSPARRRAGSSSARAPARPSRTLLSRPGRKGRELRTTLDRPVQAAAEQALGASEAEGGARRGAALDGRRPRRRQPAHRRRLRPRDRRPLRRPARRSRSSPPRRCCATGLKTSDTVDVPEDASRSSGKVVQELRGRGGGRGALRPRLRAVVQHGVRLARQAPGRPTRCTRTGARLRPRAHRAPARSRPAATRSSARRR